MFIPECDGSEAKNLKYVDHRRNKRNRASYPPCAVQKGRMRGGAESGTRTSKVGIG